MNPNTQEFLEKFRALLTEYNASIAVVPLVGWYNGKIVVDVNGNEVSITDGEIFDQSVISQVLQR